MQTMSVSLNSGKIIQSILSENDLKMALTNVVLDEESCKENLKPGGGLTETHPDKGIGTVSALKKYGGSCSDPIHTTKTDCEGALETWNTSGGIDILASGEKFNNSLDIMAITFSGDETKDPLLEEVKRTLTVYYKKPGLGKLSTLGGRETGNPNCTAANQEDCYFKQCDIEYKTDNSLGSTEVETCKALNCFSNELLLAKNQEEPRYCVLVDCESCGCVQWSNQYLPDGTEANPRLFRRTIEYNSYAYRYQNDGVRKFKSFYGFSENAKALVADNTLLTNCNTNTGTSPVSYRHGLCYSFQKTTSPSTSNHIKVSYSHHYSGNLQSNYSFTFNKNECCPDTWGKDYL